MNNLKIEFPRFKVESYEENGDTVREIHIGDRRFDVTEKPVVWYSVAGLSATTFFLVFAVLLSLIGKVFSFLDSAGVIDGVLTLAFHFFQLLVGLVFVMILLGVIKYVVTGSAEPFVSVDVDNLTETSSDTEDNS